LHHCTNALVLTKRAGLKVLETDRNICAIATLDRDIGNISDDTGIHNVAVVRMQ